MKKNLIWFAAGVGTGAAAAVGAKTVAPKFMGWLNCINPFKKKNAITDNADAGEAEDFKPVDNDK